MNSKRMASILIASTLLLGACSTIPGAPKPAATIQSVTNNAATPSSTAVTTDTGTTAPDANAGGTVSATTDISQTGDMTATMDMTPTNGVTNTTGATTTNTTTTTVSLPVTAGAGGISETTTAPLTPTEVVTPSQEVSPSNEMTPTVETTTVAPPETSGQPARIPVVATIIKSLVTRVRLNLRGGPGMNYRIIGHVAARRVLTVTGLSTDHKWWRVLCMDGSRGNCWITASSLYVVARRGDM